MIRGFIYSYLIARDLILNVESHINRDGQVSVDFTKNISDTSKVHINEAC